MEYKTKELHIIVHPNNIVEINIREDFEGELSLEGAKENMALLKNLSRENSPSLLFRAHHSYVKKEVLNYYNNHGPDEYSALTAVITKSFSTKIIGNLFITLRTRFFSRKKINAKPVKMFSNKEDAVKWLLKEMAVE